MRTALILISTLTLFCFSTAAQPVLPAHQTPFYCNFTGGQMDEVYGIYDYISDAEARQVLLDMVAVVGLKPNFVVQAASVHNAAAWINQNRRYILYNPRFMLAVRQNTRSDWSAASILAHEIGHHLNGHTLEIGPDRRQNELDADEFSGFVLRKMGASLQEAQAAVNLLISPEPTNTHPGRQQRLRAIETGWMRADDLLLEAYHDLQQGRKDDPLAASTGPEATAIAPTPPPVSLRWRVDLTSNPGRRYFITRENKFVTLREGGIHSLGELQASADRRFPYRIRMANSPDLLVNHQLRLLNSQGEPVGYLEKMR